MARRTISTPNPSANRGIIGALLFTRPLSFLMIQLIFASIFQIGGMENWWARSQAFWPITAIGGSIITFYILQKILNAEGSSYRALVKPHWPQLKKDVLFVLLLMVVVIPVTMLSNVLFSNWLFANPESVMGKLMQPLPMWAAVLSILMPFAIAFTELPFYFGYGMERLRQGNSKFWAIYLPVFFLALQHSFLPLVFSWNFFLWRFLIFLPMAILLGLFLFWRPKSLPLLMILHFLMDISVVYYVFQESF